MADEATTTQDEAGEAPKKSKMKSVVIVVALLAIEAAAILGGMTFLGSGGPESANADTGQLDPALIEQEKIVEIQVLDAKLPNARSGVSYLYSSEIYLQVKNKHAEAVEEKVQQFYNELKAEITAIWRTSEPAHFQEPKLETLTRKMTAMLNDRFGADPEGDQIVQKVVIVMGTGFRVDR